MECCYPCIITFKSLDQISMLYYILWTFKSLSHWSTLEFDGNNVGCYLPSALCSFKMFCAIVCNCDNELVDRFIGLWFDHWFVRFEGGSIAYSTQMTTWTNLGSGWQSDRSNRRSRTEYTIFLLNPFLEPNKQPDLD